jgi:hypothetical protein
LKAEENYWKLLFEKKLPYFLLNYGENLNEINVQLSDMMPGFGAIIPVNLLCLLFLKARHT